MKREPRQTRRERRAERRSCLGRLEIGVNHKAGEVVMVAGEKGLALAPAEALEFATVIDAICDRSVGPVVVIPCLLGPLMVLREHGRSIARDLRREVAAVKAGLS